MTRWPLVVGIVAWAALVCRVLVACIIADPPPTPPAQPASNPTIIQTSVVPPRPFFVEWPAEFVVPIANPSPAQYFAWAFYVDYSPEGQANNGLATFNMSVPPAPDGGVQPAVGAFSAPDGGGCHIVTFLLGQNGTIPTPQLATDSVVWGYDPLGVGACSDFDGSAFGDGAIAPTTTQDGPTLPIVKD